MIASILHSKIQGWRENKSCVRRMDDVPQSWQIVFRSGHLSWLSEQWISSEILETISVQLFLFHPSVLEPNLHLSVCKTEHSWQLQTFLFVYVHIEKEFSFKFSDLVFRIRASLFSGLCCTYKKKRNLIISQWIGTLTQLQMELKVRVYFKCLMFFTQNYCLIHTTHIQRQNTGRNESMYSQAITRHKHCYMKYTHARKRPSHASTHTSRPNARTRTWVTSRSIFNSIDVFRF